MKKYLQTSILGTLGPVSSTLTYITKFIRMDAFDSYMIQIAWTGTPVANVSLLISADHIDDIIAGQQPVVSDIVASSTISTSGKSVITYEVVKTSANWVAVQWANSSGSGTISSINLVAKGAMV